MQHEIAVNFIFLTENLYFGDIHSFRALVKHILNIFTACKFKKTGIESKQAILGKFTLYP